MPRNGHPTQTLSLLALFAARIAAGFPYNPTRIFLSQQDDRDIAYVFQPNGENGQFLSLEISKFSSISNLPLQTLYSSLPFTDSSTSTAFTPFLDESGNITVLAGDCTSSANGAELWRFTPDAQAQNGNGSWSKETVSPHDVAGDAMAGSNFLGAGVAFSEMVGGGLEDTSLYMFAGMCPTAGATVANWITAATYSNFMVTLAPEDATEAPTDYKLGLTSTRGPPIAEAGFSMTALPALSGANTSSGQTQQQNFVLLGGHTQTAFINMSQVALFSLPQENWAFLPVDQPSSAKTDLAKRDAAVEIEPRSGHTAVLSEDGKSIIVVGGWVGDVTTAATPQLAVLQLGSGYGGDGDWEWSVPDQTGVFASLGAGLYGHGAVMLPGGVVMIMGGYTISSSASRLFRRDSQVANTKSLFYNVTSNTWLSSYDPPATVTATSAQDNKSGALTSSSQKAGLAAGLTLGFVIVVCLLLFYFWYTRRLGARRDKRASDMRHLVNHSHDFDDPFLGKTGIDGRGGDIYAADVWDEEERAAREHPWLPNGQPPPGWKSDQARAREVERTGLFVNIPSPTRGLRRGLTTRNNFQYHAAPRYDESRTSRHSGNIHPIEEIEEEALSQLGSPRMSEAERKLKALEGVFGDDNQRKLRAAASILSEDAAQDPFRDPLPNPLGSHPVSPDLSHPANANIINTIKRVPTNASHAAPSLFNPNAEERENLANWVSEWSHAGGLLRSATLPNGRVSPTKTDDRTSSTLSEQSNRSNLSANSIARTASTRTAAIFGASTNPFASPQASPSEERTSFLQSGRKSPFYYNSRARSATTSSVRPAVPDLPPQHDRSDSFTTARSNFAQLQSEGEALLGPSGDTFTRGHRPQLSDTTSAILRDAGPAPPVPPRRRLGWMGSLRRALNGGGGDDRSVSATTAKPGMPQRYNTVDRSSSSSPTKYHYYQGASAAPRRAASDGGALLRAKRGKHDWEAEGDSWPAYKDEPDGGDWGETPAADPTSPSGDSIERGEGRGGEEDWDVEKAAAKRDVQVMFTVPKTRLRVVNADVEKASLRSVSDGGRSLDMSGGLGVERKESLRENGVEERDMIQIREEKDK